MTAIKFDEEKPRTDLIPPEALLEVAKIFGFGAKKYSDDNWRDGFGWRRLYGSILRHLFAWATGESLDPETNSSHLAHACCGIMMLLTHELLDLGEDDRWTNKKD